MKAPPIIAHCNKCRRGYTHMRQDLQWAACLTEGCEGIVYRTTKADSRNSRGEATYAVPIDRFPPQPLPRS